jgi:hypothetical protein
MEPVLPDEPVEEGDFDLDVRLQPVARASKVKGAQCPSDQGTTCVTCTLPNISGCQAGCS